MLLRFGFRRLPEGVRVVHRRDDSENGDDDNDDRQPHPHGVRQLIVGFDGVGEKAPQGAPQRPEDDVDAEHAHRVLGVLPRRRRDALVGVREGDIEAGENEDPRGYLGRYRNGVRDGAHEVQHEFADCLQRHLRYARFGHLQPTTVEVGHRQGVTEAALPGDIRAAVNNGDYVTGSAFNVISGSMTSIRDAVK